MSPRISPHTTASRDSMIPSVTNGATIGSAASKKHEKLPRGLSATMIVLPRNHREQHRTSRSCLLMTARMAPIFREAFQKCMQGGTGRSAQTHLHSVAAAEPPVAKSLCVCGAHPVGMDARRHTGGAAHHTYQPWRGGVADPVGEILPSQR